MGGWRLFLPQWEALQESYGYSTPLYRVQRSYRRASPTSVIPGHSASIRDRKMGHVEMSLITRCTTRACHRLLLLVIR
jgi:hypothetical protein